VRRSITRLWLTPLILAAALGAACPSISWGLGAGLPAQRAHSQWLVDQNFVRPISNAKRPVCSPGGTCLAQADLSGKWIDVLLTSQGVRGYWPTVSGGNPAFQSCPTSDVCVGIVWHLETTPQRGALLRTTDAGRRWTRVPLPRSITIPDSVACPTAADCVVIGTDPAFDTYSASTEDGGKTWSVWKLPNVLSGDYFGVVCPSTSTCFALQPEVSPAVLIETKDFGKTWTQVRVPLRQGEFFLNALSCWSGNGCGLVITSCDASACSYGGVLRYAKVIDGAVVSIRPVPGRLVESASISCPSASSCVLTETISLRSHVLATSNGGRTWAGQELPKGIGEVFPECTSPGQCVGVGFGRYRSAEVVFLRYG